MSDELEIEYFFDVASPYSYLASTQVDALEDKTGVPVRWRPFLLGGVMKETGNTPPARIPAKGRYMLSDLNRWAERYEIPFEMPAEFPINTLTTQRALIVAGVYEEGALRRLAERLFHDYWVEGIDVSRPAAIREAVEAVDLPGDEVLARTRDSTIKDRLRDNSDEAVERGAFGAPTFFVGDEMFWGNDRLEFVERAARRAAGD